MLSEETNDERMLTPEPQNRPVGAVAEELTDQELEAISAAGGAVYAKGVGWVGRDYQQRPGVYAAWLRSPSNPEGRK
jgi:hypothetical protein